MCWLYIFVRRVCESSQGTFTALEAAVAAAAAAAPALGVKGR